MRVNHRGDCQAAAHGSLGSEAGICKTICCLALALALVCLGGACSAKPQRPGVLSDAHMDQSTAVEQDSTGSTDAWDAVQGAKDVTVADQAAADPDAEIGDQAAADTPPPGLQTCASVGDCVAAACTLPTPGCEQNCYAKALPAALTLAKPLVTCVQDKCQNGKCKGSTASQCATDCAGAVCGPELLACANSATTGAATCTDAMTCLGACGAQPAGYYSCVAGCIAALSPAAKDGLTAVVSCQAQAQQAGADPAQKCSAQSDACLSDGNAGAKSCYEFFVCVSACADPESPDCGQKCMAELSPAAQHAFSVAQPCLGGQGMTSDPACVANLLACVNPSGKNTCAQTMACQSACATASASNSGACAMACLHDASPTTAADYLGVSMCGAAQTAAQQTACADAFVSCAAPSGTSTCADILACMGKCGPTAGADCMLACVGKGSAQGAASFAKWFACQNTCQSTCKTSTDPTCPQTCATVNCAAAVAECGLK